MVRNRRIVRPLASVVGATLLFAACGSDGGSAGGGSIEDWCSFAAEAAEVDEIFDSLGQDPAAVEIGIKRVKEIAEQLPGKAPDAVAAPAKTLSESALLIVKALEDADYNIFDADLAVLSDAALEASNDAANIELDEFTKRECGRPFGADDDTGDDTAGTTPAAGDDSGFDPSAGTLREQLVAQFETIGLSNSEATCIADKLDFSDPAVQSGDIAAMLGVFGECNISLDRLGELGQG